MRRTDVPLWPEWAHKESPGCARECLGASQKVVPGPPYLWKFYTRADLQQFLMKKKTYFGTWARQRQLWRHEAYRHTSLAEMSSECPAGVLQEAPCERPGPSGSILEVSPKRVPMPTAPIGIPFIRKRTSLLSKLFTWKLKYSKKRVTCQLFWQHEAYRRASLAGMGSRWVARVRPGVVPEAVARGVTI